MEIWTKLVDTQTIAMASISVVDTFVEAFVDDDLHKQLHAPAHFEIVLILLLDHNQNISTQI